MSNYIISIGGTGIRVLRSIIHLCDCGHIDVSELKVLLIDPDITNGSKDAVRQLIGDYNDCRDDIRKPDTARFAPFKTKISQAVSADWALTPVTNLDGTDQVSSYRIQDLVNRNGHGSDEEINFMKALYSYDEYANKDMSEGFFAHPSIGALAFARWLDESSHVKELIADMSQDAGAKGEDVNVFIIASSFGGTGASGFPAVARKIKNSLKDYADKVHIAGVFLLPYFTFMRKEGTDQLLDPKKFIEGAKNAMVYYREHKVTDVFDKVYVLGVPDTDSANKSPRIIRNKYADKGKEQDNWPHIIELYAALAAKECFSSSVADLLKNKNSNPDRNWVGISVAKTSFFELKWEDMPGGEALRKSLSKFLLFNYMYIPAVLNEFAVHTTDGLKKKHPRRERVIWAPIADIPFMTIKKWNEDTFGDNQGMMKFKRLLDYFNGHITWLYRLLTDYEQNDERKEQLFTGLFHHQMLRNRYEIARSMEKNVAVDFSSVAKNISHTDKGNVGEGSAFVTGNRVLWGYVYDEVYNLVGRDIKSKENVDDAIREILQSIYNRVSKHIN